MGLFKKINPIEWILKEISLNYGEIHFTWRTRYIEQILSLTKKYENKASGDS